jgi:transcriptional regulator with XRE-family HTH domain
MTFGEVLTILRNRQGLTVEELADLVDWKPHRIRSLEQGTEYEAPTKAEAVKLAEALDVDPRLLTVAVPRE